MGRLPLLRLLLLLLPRPRPLVWLRSRQRGVRPLRLRLLLLQQRQRGNKGLLLPTLLPPLLLLRRTLSTPKCPLILDPTWTQATTLSTRWLTTRRRLTSQGTRTGTATSSPAPTRSSTPPEHWSPSTTRPVSTDTLRPGLRKLARSR